MIDEKKLIEELEMHCNNINPNSLLYLVKGAWDDCIEIIKRQPKVGEWIPCSERLPEDFSLCLVTRIISSNKLRIKHASVCIAVRYKGRWLKRGKVLNDKYIIAWMPLPEAYKGDK